MMGTRKLTDVAEDGVAAIRRADTSVKIVIALAAACLVVGLCTLAAVLAAARA